MPLTHFARLLAEVDSDLDGASPADVPGILARLPNDLFALLIWRRELVLGYRRLCRYLIPLPSPEVQRHWTGASGEELLPATCAFVSYLDRTVQRHLKGACLRYLDYGCGWGRFSAFLPKFTTIDCIFAVDQDPDMKGYFDRTILAGRFWAVDSVPDSFPIAGQFDVVFLFSVLTHTPPVVTERLAHRLRAVLRPGGIAVVTIRPRAYWTHHATFPEGHSADQLMRAHDERGWAFMRHGDRRHYGDASYSNECLGLLFHGFDVVDRSVSVVDPFQIMVTLRRRPGTIDYKRRVRSVPEGSPER